MSTDDWERFQRVALADPGALGDLFAIMDGAAFVDRCVDLAAQRSLVLDAADVEAALRAGDRRWIEHWL